jgi:hypothetical protein
MTQSNAARQTIPANGWSASYSETPPASRVLKVEGTVELPTPGYKLHLTKAQHQGHDPKTLVLTLHKTAPTGIEPQHVVHQPVAFEEKTTTSYAQVLIEPENIKIHVTDIL